MFQHDNQPKTDVKTALQVLASELKEILKEKTGHLLPVSEVMITYYQRYKCHMKVGELGFRHLPELLQALPGLKVGKHHVSVYSLNSLHLRLSTMCPFHQNGFLLIRRYIEQIRCVLSSLLDFVLNF